MYGARENQRVRPVGRIIVAPTTPSSARSRVPAELHPFVDELVRIVVARLRSPRPENDR